MLIAILFNSKNLKMTQQVEMLATKPDYMSLIPKIHIVEGGY